MSALFSFRFSKPKVWPNIDWATMLLAVALSLFGVATIWGASSTEGEPGPFRGYARVQFQWLLIGIAAMTFLVATDYRWTKAAAWPMYLGILGVLLVVAFHGSKVKGATSWFILDLGPRKVSFQPSEPAKVATVILLARYLSGRIPRFRGLLNSFPAIALAAIPMGAIFLQPDLGTAVTFIPVTLVMMFIAGLRLRVFAFYFLLVAGISYAAYPHLKPYQKERIRTFIEPGRDALGKGYNVIQAQTAMGSGGFAGKGWGRGTQTSFRFLPEYQTDFVFPTLGEQFGFAGCMAALALYSLLLLRILYLAGRVEDLFGVLLICGFATVLVTHIILNIGMATGLLPVTGLPLPFFSYGGSFMLTCFIMIGLIVSAAARREL